VPNAPSAAPSTVSQRVLTATAATNAAMAAVALALAQLSPSERKTFERQIGALFAIASVTDTAQLAEVLAAQGRALSTAPEKRGGE